MKRVLLMLCAAFWLAPARAAPAAPARPNILLVVLDDIGVGDLGFCGARDIPTPNIDRLVREGVICTAGYVQPMCAPTRAMLLTGRYPQRLGYEDNRPFDTAHTGLDRNIPTLPEQLRAAGYATALVGKWHLGKGLKFEYAPRNRGFDEFFGYFGAFGSYLDPTYSRNGVEQVCPGYGTDLLTAEACARLRAWKDKPFFLHLAYTAAHLKQAAKPADLAKFAHLDPKRQMAAAIISNLDENVGRLRQALQDAGLTERTLTFFLSDNGAEPLVLGTRNGPYRGQKFDLYEGGVRVPFVAHWPGTLPGDRTYAAPVSAMDVMPTCLAAAGAATGETDGVNLLPFLSGTSNAVPHEALFWRTTDHAQWRHAREQGKPASHLSAVRQGDWKLVVLDEEGANRQELFNLADDPGEARDLAAQEPERRQALRAVLDGWRTSLKPQIIPPAPRKHAGQAAEKQTPKQP
jgi:arylsulfatase A-like enzyme